MTMLVFSAMLYFLFFQYTGKTFQEVAHSNCRRKFTFIAVLFQKRFVRRYISAWAIHKETFEFVSNYAQMFQPELIERILRIPTFLHRKLVSTFYTFLQRRFYIPTNWCHNACDFLFSYSITLHAIMSRTPLELLFCRNIHGDASV